MMKARVLLGLGLAAAGVASARTVALWPLEVFPNNGGIDARCAVNPANDFAVVADNAKAEAQGMAWSLPPNPDTARTAWRPLNEAAVRNVPGGGMDTGLLYNDRVGDCLARECAFTVEGFVKLLDLPESNKWSVVMTAFNDNGGDPHRWVLSFRRQPKHNYACSWVLYAQDGGGGDVDLHVYDSEEASYALTNTWMHVALTHQPTDDNKEVWKLYLDGALVGEKVQAIPIRARNAHRFSLGAREGNQPNPLPAVLDYWRISDEVLEPEGFLNAGGAGTQIARSSTVSYWPLDLTPNGGVDGRDAVGDSPLIGGNGFNNMGAFRESRLGASEDCAFTGNPPNPTVTLPGGNAGSLQGCATSASLQTDGAMLNLAQDFTVEGWFAPRICERAVKGTNAQAVCYLFGTRPDYGRGWNLEYRASGEKDVSFVIYARDQKNNVLVDNACVSGDYDMANWYETWHHVALTYDADGGANGFGRWELFIDGVRTGGCDNARVASPITDGRPFSPGGRGNIYERSFQGKMDCLRVCTAVLAPEQFMCTANGTAATDIYALWPLNVSRGVALNLEDVSGNDRHFAKLDSMASKQQVTAAPGDAPEISNPDSTPAFRGSRTHLTGSTGFRKLSGDNQHRACLVTGSSHVMDAVKDRQGFTLECYYKRDAEATRDQECLFVVCSGASARARIFRKGDGLYVWESMYANPNLDDTRIPGTADGDLVAGVWHHLAVVHTIEKVDGVDRTVWRVYVNGVLKGEASQTARDFFDTSVNFLTVGGRWFADNNSVNGNLSSVRLSRGALAPAEFLCATPAESVVALPQTVAYWPIDASGNGLANLADAESPLAAEGTAQAQTESACASIPNVMALTNLVTGAARRNQGSYALGESGALLAESVGFALSLCVPFTVEGWLKYDASGAAAEQDLVTAGEGEAMGGVRIWIERAGAAHRLRVKARGAWPCTPFVDAAFDVDLAAFAGVWTHLAIAYDPEDGMGSWSLFVDGKPVGGKVCNFYYPTVTDYFRSGAFRIGSTERPLAGEVDMWRLTAGALAPTELLYAAPSGMVIFVR
ncbi:MAG: LamG-like jellyroll fold domain-containing protein [Kiritimatiellia bacterium]